MAVEATPLDTAARDAAGELVELLKSQRRNRHEAQQTELKARLAELAAEHKEANARVETLTADLATEQREQRDVAGQVAAADAKIQTMETRLAAGEGMTSRDLLALQADIDSAKARRAGLEDRELAAMERIEDLEAKVAAAKEDAGRIAAEGQAAQRERKEAAARLAADAEDLATRIAQRLDALPGLVTAKIRADLDGGGVGLAAISGGACGSCGEAFSGATAATVNAAAAGTVFSCEACEAPLLKP